MLEEYLFIDERRIATYFNQFAAPVVYDKVPVWKAELSMLSTGVEATQTRAARQPTIFEKLHTVREAISRSGQVLSERSFGGMEPEQSAPFREETVVACKVRFGPRDGYDDPPMGLTVWLAYAHWQTDPSNEWQTKNGSLYLCQDYPGDDAAIYCHLSPVSFISALLRDTPTQVQRIVGELPEEWRDMEFEMRVDPDRVLQDLGAKIGEPRRIRSLYRIRTFYREWARKASTDPAPTDTRPATFGYPLYIKEVP